MTKVLTGQPVVQALKEHIRNEVFLLEAKGITPTMGIIRVGKRPDDIAYEKSIIKNCKSVGIQVKVFQTEVNIAIEQLIDLVHNVNSDQDIHGILLFQPLPDLLNIDHIKHLMVPEKDIDCINSVNLEKIFEGKNEVFFPCTPEAVIEVLKFYQIPLTGANIAVINRSMVLGKPLAMMLLEEQSTVTICHSKTRNLQEITSRMDIVITGVGKAHLFGQEYFHKDAIVIDVGINDIGNGKIGGDVKYDEVKEKVKAITPVPGGIGTVTTAILLRHVLEACKKQQIG
jgi:methylenetetrahydrofolate dehydrogenase (NADP+)/methenyltetrahydrofolate cyclohydrolase